MADGTDLSNIAENESDVLTFDIDKFQQLLDKLEGSKGRQKRQESLESRRNIFAQGLASMMSNF